VEELFPADGAEKTTRVWLREHEGYVGCDAIIHQVAEWNGITNKEAMKKLAKA